MRQLMEGETRKRKITNICGEDEDEDEDIKMEKFFALIRSAKDIRDQLLDAEGSSKERAKKAVATAEKKAEVAVAVRAAQRNNEKGFATFATATVAAVDADAVVPNKKAAAAAAAAADSAARVSRSAAVAAEEENSRKTGDQKNEFKGGRIFLDLNLSL